jgi:hypothetical protein
LVHISVPKRLSRYTVQEIFVMSSCQCILSDLIHDLAQPLGNIETSAYCLGRIIDPENPRAQEHLRMIQQQLDTASAMLSAVAAELRRRNAERVEASPAFDLAASASR